MPNRATEKNDALWQAPLGPHPAYDDVVDQGIEYTFPCSDPVAVGSCCSKLMRAVALDGRADDEAADTPRRASRQRRRTT